MAEIQNSNPVQSDNINSIQTKPDPTFNFNVIVPTPFVLSEQPEEHLRKIKDEIMDKVTTWESRMSNSFFKSYFKAADSWRIKPDTVRKEGKNLFNSKSGETHRAAETLATVWFRMLTANDPYFEVVARGLNDNGMEVTEEELYATTGVLTEQQRVSRFKRKLLRSLRSAALMGVTVVEEPFVSMPYGSGRKYMEFTDWVFRPMIRTGFDTTVYDINDSDFIFFIDFFSKWMLRNVASQDSEYWNQGLIENHIKEYSRGSPGGKSGVYSRIQSSRSRAGYTDVNADIYENISYHGRIDSENPVVQAFAESINLDRDPKYVDWSVCLLDSTDVSKFHMTQYGDWRTRAKILTYKDFEDEPLPYGIGQIGRKLQREMDITESLTNDKAVFDVLNMWRIGKYSGYDAKQFIAEPMKMVELEDVSQMLPLVGDPNILRFMLELIGLRREDFRNVVGAQTNLQAQITGASATESALAQTEAIRGASVQAEIIAEIIRDHLEISHINNLNYMDEPIWVGLTGKKKPVLADKRNLPINVGFLVKAVTDKDFRPEEVKNILQSIQIFSSIRQFMPTSLNALPHLVKQLFRKFGMNPALLSEPMSQADQLEIQTNRIANSGGASNEIAGEVTGYQAGNEVGQDNLKQTPVGLVPTSPISPSMDMSA